MQFCATTRTSVLVFILMTEYIKDTDGRQNLPNYVLVLWKTLTIINYLRVFVLYLGSNILIALTNINIWSTCFQISIAVLFTICQAKQCVNGIIKSQVTISWGNKAI